MTIAPIMRAHTLGDLSRLAQIESYFGKARCSCSTVVRHFGIFGARTVFRLTRLIDRLLLGNGLGPFDRHEILHFLRIDRRFKPAPIDTECASCRSLSLPCYTPGATLAPRPGAGRVGPV
jgi:hypothetical protein